MTAHQSREEADAPGSSDIPPPENPEKRTLLQGATTTQGIGPADAQAMSLACGLLYSYCAGKAGIRTGCGVLDAIRSPVDCEAHRDRGNSIGSTTLHETIASLHS